MGGLCGIDGDGSIMVAGNLSIGICATLVPIFAREEFPDIQLSRCKIPRKVGDKLEVKVRSNDCVTTFTMEPLQSTGPESGYTNHTTVPRLRTAYFTYDVTRLLIYIYQGTTGLGTVDIHR